MFRVGDRVIQKAIGPKFMGVVVSTFKSMSGHNMVVAELHNSPYFKVFYSEELDYATDNQEEEINRSLVNRSQFFQVY